MIQYLVRHGESVTNKLLVYQGADDPLTELGRTSAKELGIRFHNLPIDIIITSDLLRAVETAAIISAQISEYTGKEIKITKTALLREKKNPSIVIGKPHKDQEAFKISRLIEKHFGEEGWHFADEENFDDLLKRADQYEKYLKQFKQEHILTVTHGGFLKFLVANRAFGHLGRDVLVNAVKSFDRTFRSDNTGITACQKSMDGRWEVMSFNDVAHLGV